MSRLFILFFTLLLLPAGRGSVSLERAHSCGDSGLVLLGLLLGQGLHHGRVGRWLALELLEVDAFLDSMHWEVKMTH